MKTFLVLAVSIVLVSILCCPISMAAPPMPDGLQIVQPDPSLPKELSAFWGKWEGATGMVQYFLIIEKIDEKQASLWVWKSGGTPLHPQGWNRYEARVFKVRGEYKLGYRDPFGNTGLALKGEYLDYANKGGNPRLTRVP